MLHNNIQIPEITDDSIRIITRGSILESYRKLLHAFWWFASKGYRRSHTCIFTCSRWSVFKNQTDFFFFSLPLINLLDNLTSNLSTFPYTAAQCEKFLELLKMSRGTTYTFMPVKKKIGKKVLTQPFCILDNIRDGHVVAYVGENLLPSAVGDICSDFPPSPV